MFSDDGLYWQESLFLMSERYNLGMTLNVDIMLLSHCSHESDIVTKLDDTRF